MLEAVNPRGLDSAPDRVAAQSGLVLGRKTLIAHANTAVQLILKTMHLAKKAYVRRYFNACCLAGVVQSSEAQQWQPRAKVENNANTL